MDKSTPSDNFIYPGPKIIHESIRDRVGSVAKKQIRKNVIPVSQDGRKELFRFDMIVNEGRLHSARFPYMLLQNSS